MAKVTNLSLKTQGKQMDSITLFPLFMKGILIKCHLQFISEPM